MKFTAFTPQIPVDHLLPLARAADAAGWDGYALPDSVFYVEKVTAKYPYTEDGSRPWAPETPYIDPLAAFPAMAAVTERLFFFSNVLKTPLHQPLLLAKTVGSMAALFPGRIALGLGTSWLPQEFEWVHEDIHTRGKRLNEMIEIMRRCWAGGWASYHGTHYSFDNLMMSPWPSQPVPLYVGGEAPAALRRAATLADGWSAAYSDPEDLKKILPQMLVQRADSPMAGKPFEVITTAQQPPSLDFVRRLEDAGVTNITVVPYAYDEQALGAKGDAVKRFADDVIHRYRD